MDKRRLDRYGPGPRHGVQRGRTRGRMTDRGESV